MSGGPILICRRRCMPCEQRLLAWPLSLFSLETLEMIEGDLPSRAKKLVVEWASMYQNELKEMWDKQEFHKLPPLQ